MSKLKKLLKWNFKVVTLVTTLIFALLFFAYCSGILKFFFLITQQFFCLGLVFWPFGIPLIGILLIYRFVPIRWKRIWFIAAVSPTLIGTLGLWCILWYVFLYPIQFISESEAKQFGLKLLAQECKLLKLSPNEYQLFDIDHDPGSWDWPASYTLKYYHSSLQDCMDISITIRSDDTVENRTPRLEYYGPKHFESLNYCYSYLSKKGFKLDKLGHFDIILQKGHLKNEDEFIKRENREIINSLIEVK